MSKAHQNLRRWAGKLPLATKLSFSLVDQFQRTLMRLRLGRMKQELADQFGISRSAVSCCLITWVNVSAPRFAGYLATLDCSPDRNMPTVFAQPYSKAFCIMDATELRCESPSSLSGQSQLQISYHTERVSWDRPQWTTYSCKPAIFCGYRWPPTADFSEVAGDCIRWLQHHGTLSLWNPGSPGAVPYFT